MSELPLDVQAALEAHQPQPGDWLPEWGDERDQDFFWRKKAISERPRPFRARPEFEDRQLWVLRSLAESLRGTGELTALVAYVKALQKKARPMEHFGWAEDWDK